MRTALILFFTLCVQAGCASYKEPQSSARQVATLYDQSSDSLFSESSAFWIDSIDGESTENFFTGRPSEVSLTPGSHIIGVHAFKSGGLLSFQDPRETWLNLRVNFEAGKSYALKGKVEGTKAVAWIVDQSTGQNVSETATETFNRVQQPVYIPVYTH